MKETKKNLKKALIFNIGSVKGPTQGKYTIWRVGGTGSMAPGLLGGTVQFSLSIILSPRQPAV